MNVFIQCFDMERPMSWRSFNRLPVKKQIEYLNFLKLEMGFTNNLISDMFNIHENTLIRRTKQLGLNFSDLSRREDPTMAQRWRAWLLHPADPDVKDINDQILHIVPKELVMWE